MKYLSYKTTAIGKDELICYKKLYLKGLTEIDPKVDYESLNIAQRVERNDVITSIVKLMLLKLLHTR